MDKPLLKVSWRDISGIDSANNSSAWFNEKQILKEAQKLYDQIYISVGYLVSETSDFIVLAATTDCGEDPLWSDASMIMKNVIIKSERLGEK